MNRLLGAAIATVLVFGTVNLARGEDKDAMAVVDKGIKALGGEEKLSSIKAVSWKAITKTTLGGRESAASLQLTIEGLDKIRAEMERKLNGNTFQVVSVVAGDMGWRKNGDMTNELHKEEVADQKRVIYLHVVPMTLVALKGKDFKVEAVSEEKGDGDPATGIKVTGPDKKDFTLFFDKESGLPVKMVAKFSRGRGGDFTIATTYGGYKELSGIKKATKIESKRDGDKFQEMEISDFKVLDKVDPKMFEEPK